MIAFKFHGKPLGKARHRTTKKGHTYNPQSKEEAAVKWEAREQYRGEIITGPVVMDIRAVFARPKSQFGTGKNQHKLKPSSPRYHTVKPDFDNIAKFYSDCLNGIVYLDDAQVIGGDMRKEYSDDRNFIGLVEIEIWQIEV